MTIRNNNSKNSNITFNGVRQGFSLRDSVYLRDNDNAQADPQIQIFTAEDLEEEDPEQRNYYCVCRSRLDYHKHLDIWICSECFAQYDTNIQDVPLKDISRQKVLTYPELTFNPTYDELDLHMTFVEGIDLDKEIDREQVELLRSTEGRRVQHIRVKGSPTKALAAMNEIDGKT